MKISNKKRKKPQSSPTYAQRDELRWAGEEDTEKSQSFCMQFPSFSLCFFVLLGVLCGYSLSYQKTV